ncbi:MAG: SsrA-binding protein SmpB [Oligoflexales bacterium]
MSIKIISNNRKAFHEYHVGEKFEAGMVLKGTEVKSLRDGKANLTDGWVEIVNGEAFVRDIQISPYSHGNLLNHEQKRVRKLLLKQKELIKIEEALAERGLAVIPISLYFKESLAKLEIAICKGKKLHDKRESEKSKDAKREMSRSMRVK